MSVRAIRGAITVTNNDHEDIVNSTKELLNKMIELNDINKDDMVSIFFTTTKDVNEAFPSVAAREMGLTDVPLMCAGEIDVPGSLKKCIRVMIYINTDKGLSDMNHVYLKDAKKLRPDLVR